MRAYLLTNGARRMAVIDIYHTNNKYDVIYTDPPWKQTRGGYHKARPFTSGNALPYDVMDLADIKELHRFVFENLAAERHNVFMWTIEKYLRDTEDMMRELGYKLHVRFVWDKGNGPTPAYTVRFQHEYLLWFFKPGGIVLPRDEMRGKFGSVLREGHTVHSRKPDCAYTMIEQMFPADARRLELFARRQRAGWDSYGNEL